MAQQEATLILKIKDAGSAALKSVGSVFDRLVITAGDVVNGFKAVVAAGVEFAQLGSEISTVRQAFINLALSQGQSADAMLNKMRQLSAGTISDLELMKQANTALLLGLPVDRFGDMLEIARSSARATGQSMDFMLNSIVTGLGRGSKLMLDNLGILINVEKANEDYAKSLGKTAAQLTDAEKKQAFINEALRVGKLNADAAGGANLTLADKIARATAQFENMRGKLAEQLSPVMSAVFDSFSGLIGAMGGSGSIINTISGSIHVLGSTLVVATGLFEKVGMVAGNVIGGIAEAAGNLAQGNFRAAWKNATDIVKFSLEEWAATNDRTMARLQEMDIAYLQAKENTLLSEEEMIRASNERKAIMADEHNMLMDEKKLEQDIKEQDRRLLEEEMVYMTETQKLAAQIKALDDRLKAEENFQAKMKMVKDRSNLIDMQRAALKVEKQKELDKKREADQQATLNTIATMQSANNSVLAAIGKAAAMTQIAIDTPVAVGKALAAFPPPFNFVAAGLVGAAMAVQAARVAGVKLAEGGIVPATHGGTRATIGEGGRAEAVIPLPDDFDPNNGFGGGGGGGNTFVFNGLFLGDQNQGRELAIMVDRELLKLRQRNESVAFEEDAF